MSCLANETAGTGSMINFVPSSYFMDSISASLLFSYVIASGINRFKNGKCETTAGSDTLSCSVLFKVQVLITVLLSAFAVVQDVLYLTEVFVSDNPQATTSLYLQTLFWPTSLIILFVEGQRLVQTTIADRKWILPLFWTSAFVHENLALFHTRNSDWLFKTSQSLAEKMEILMPAFRYTLVFGLFISGINSAFAPAAEEEKKEKSSQDEEEEEEAESHKEISPFQKIVGCLQMFLPFVWPQGNRRLQFFAFICLLMLIIARCIAVIRPHCYKELVDSLTNIESQKAAVFRWDLVVFYIGIEFLEESLSSLRSTLWNQVSEYTVRNVEKELFSHVHRLSLGWHLSRKTGEVLDIVNSGTSSAESLVSYLIFSVGPSIVDLAIAIIYFVTAFNAGFAIILLITCITYSVLTYWLTGWLEKLNKDPIELYSLLHSIRVDSLLNFETVKCFNAEDYEVERYNKCLLDSSSASWKQSIGYDIVQIVQKLVTTGGLLAGSLLCIYIITNKQGMTMGDYVLFVAYTGHFYSPMYMFGGLYSYLHSCYMEMEKLFVVLNEEEDVKDIPNAPDLVVTHGRVEFANVSFSYKPERPILKNISFIVQPGQTVAFVGPTGSGKSTIARLIFRLYDVGEGTISIDYQNISKVTQKTVRQSIGIVPQDTVLFNTDIRYNIRYGKLDASDDEVEKAAIAAEIHKAILGFPEGYSTIVGERGLKLSGGEKQRVAIARTILKSAPITLLDEATSSLDTQTERNIQSSLNQVCASKTTIIIAHRLSTIIHAHQICVLKDGEIIERGTHEELLNLDGEYKLMWQSQVINVPEAGTTPSEAQPESEDKEQSNENDLRNRPKSTNISVDR